MERVNVYRNSIWRVPLIALIAGVLYTPLYVRLVIKFGVIEPGVIDQRVSLLVAGGILLAVLVPGGVILLRKQSRREIAVSAAVVSAYELALFLLQRIFGITSGPAAVVFMHLSEPLEWTGFFSELHLYLQDEFGISCFFMGWLRFFVPFLFVLFGRKTAQIVNASPHPLDTPDKS